MSPESQVWQMPKPLRPLVQHRLENFAGHRRMLNSVAAKVSHVSAHAPHAEHAKIITNVGQLRIRMIQHTNAVDLKALLLQILGNVNWKVAPASDQTDLLAIFRTGKCS
jgi:hypothetical protein